MQLTHCTLGTGQESVPIRTGWAAETCVLGGQSDASVVLSSSIASY